MVTLIISNILHKVMAMGFWLPFSSSPAALYGSPLFKRRIRVAAGMTVLVILLALTPAPAFANCINPPGVPGEIVYNDAFCTMQQCQGTYWMAMGPKVSPCAPTTPNWIVAAGTVATISELDTLSVQVQAVDDTAITYSKVGGDAWISIHATTGMLTGTPPGVGTFTITARATDTAANYANRTFTVVVNATGAPGGCPNIGDICADGTIFAGISPDGNKNMYVTRCDQGQSWDSGTSACIGTRDSIVWNDGSTNYTFTGITVSNKGEFNTDTLMTIDSNDDGGAGIEPDPHNAAKVCYDLNLHGQTDWYLPATSEMAVIYENLIDGTPNNNVPDPIVSGFAFVAYWTSNEHSSPSGTAAFNISLSTSGVGSLSKNLTAYVRCARRD